MFKKSLLIILLLVNVAQGVTQDQPKLIQLKKIYNNAKKSYLAAQKNIALKQKYVSTALAYANAIMRATCLPPKSKYPVALAIYREVLKIEPKNIQAKESRDLIISVYKSMGRPIPH